MNYPEMYDRREKLVRDVVDSGKGDHVPVISMAQTWAMSYAGTDAYETFTTVDHELEVYGKHLKEIPFDCTLLFGMNRPIELNMCLGYAPFFFSDDRITLQNRDSQLLPWEEMDEYISDPIKYMRNKMLYRRYPAYRKNAFGAMMKSVSKLLAFKKKCDSLPEYLRTNVGTPVLISNLDLVEPALDRYVGWRTFANGMVDLRRHGDKVHEALDATYEEVVKPAAGQRESFPYAFAPVVSATYLNQKQYDEFFWPTFRKMADMIVDNGGKLAVALEGRWGGSKVERFLELPSRSLVLFLEDDDLPETKKIIGDSFAICSGVSTPLVANGTPEENVEYVKRMLGEVGTDSLILATGKCWLSPSDARAENLQAVCEFAHSYEV